MDIKDIKSAQDWIDISLDRVNINSSEFQLFRERVPLLCKKRKGIYSMLRNAPTKDLDRAIDWYAVKIGKHYADWRNLALWTETVTILLMRADEDQRARFDELMEQATDVAKIIKKARESGDYVV
jgi:hypothetical protein